MVRVLQDKSLSTKFRILVELAEGQPSIQQKDIASRLGVTPQAISQYIEKLIEDGWVVSDGRSKYRVTREGVNWILTILRELESYSALAEGVVTNLTICTAVADCDLSQGQTVGLEMKSGLLLATRVVGKGAKGVAVSDAKKGEDVGISNVEGIVELQTGKITILKVPGIQKGGSKRVDLAKLKEEIGEALLLGAVGIEALMALKRLDVTPQYLYGVKEATVEAARSGLSPVVVCVEEDVPGLVQRLTEDNLSYELLDLEAEEKSR
jgi:putative transcriptional regulator